MTTRRFRNVYDDGARADSYARLAFPGTYYLAFRDLPELLAAHVAGRRALDFGCGAGRSTRFLRDLGFTVTGVDIAAAMLERAREADPQGDYRLLPGGSLDGLEPGSFDLILSAFTFDNIPALERKAAILGALGRLLGPRGRLVNLVSSAEIYLHEWASFSTKDFPENRAARTGDVVRIVMLDVEDRRPVEDILCTEESYQEAYRSAGLRLLLALKPLGRAGEPYAWVSETRVAPWTVHLLERGAGPAAGPR